MPYESTSGSCHDCRNQVNSVSLLSSLVPAAFWVHFWFVMLLWLTGENPCDSCREWWKVLLKWLASIRHLLDASDFNNPLHSASLFPWKDHEPNKPQTSLVNWKVRVQNMVVGSDGWHCRIFFYLSWFLFGVWSFSALDKDTEKMDSNTSKKISPSTKS